MSLIIYWPNVVIKSSIYTTEVFYIYKEIKANNQINDKGIFRHNIVLDTIIHRDTGRGQPIQ